MVFVFYLVLGNGIEIKVVILKIVWVGVEGSECNCVFLIRLFFVFCIYLLVINYREGVLDLED